MLDEKTQIQTQMRLIQIKNKLRKT